MISFLKVNKVNFLFHFINMFLHIPRVLVPYTHVTLFPLDLESYISRDCLALFSNECLF